MIQTTAVQAIQRHWWMLALRGLLAIIFGLIAIVFPHIALLAFIYVFGAYALIGGIVAVIVALRERGSLGRWGWVLFEGILSIIAGLIAFVFPGLTALVWIYAIVFGVLFIIRAFQLRSCASSVAAQAI